MYVLSGELSLKSTYKKDRATQKDKLDISRVSFKKCQESSHFSRFF